ncbi:MAG: thiamine phosphate synthase [Nitrospirota bacterium]
MKNWLEDLKLYLITDRKIYKTQCALYFALEDALNEGVKAVQLREKDLPVRKLLEMAHWMRELTGEYGAKLLINDRVDVALSVGADGVHLGQKSIPPYAVRKVARNKLLIGSSAHSLTEALKAEREGADFITLGPVYETPSKLSYGHPVGVETLRTVKLDLRIPVLAIGGIKPDRVREVREAGADGVALISAILAAENVKDAARNFVRLVK